ncbi:uncharacterized protein [Dendropsophus ebraccatus]|uniref:uncharacterized protein n=1 Tax=Dendropsophus ebraccatus TaxID=150705 RepID=UPI00383222F5
MASAALGKELECSICLNLYTDPVTLRCGHNFCRGCIDQVLNTQDGAGVYSCPECREELQERPTLQRNITLCNVVENFLSTHLDNGFISCTYCVDSPVSAVRSCLLCEASLCDKHLRFHSKSPEHVLTDPSTSLKKKKCSVHKKVLEYYCIDDATCICVSCCLIGEHKGHNLESLEEAFEKKKEKYRNVLQKLFASREKTEKRVRSVEEHWREAKEKASGEAERVTALFIDIRKRLDDLEKRILSEISRQKEKMSLSLSDVIQKLEIKKDELSRKMRHIEELCIMVDPLTVLQDPDTGDLCDPEEEGGDEDKEGHDGGEEDNVDLCDSKEEEESVEDSEDMCGSEEVKDEENLCDSEEKQKGDENTSSFWDLEEEGSDEDTDDSYDPEEEGSDEDTDDSYDPEEEGSDEDTDDLYDPEEEGIDEDTMYVGYGWVNEGTVGHDGGDEDIRGHNGSDQGLEMISRISHTLSDMIRDVTFYIQEPADISLDVNTAHNNLLISDDLKTITSVEENQNRPESAERFQYYQVMGSGGFSSGRHYWDVEISRSEDWRLGMCYPSIDRRGGQSYIGDNNNSWGLCGGVWCRNKCSVIHNGNMIQLPHQISSNRFRICLDYEAGQLSFYELCDPIRHLHTFTATFTEPLHAVLCVILGSIKISGRSSRCEEPLSKFAPRRLDLDSWSLAQFCFHFLLLLSAMASAALRKQLECSICLNLYTDPVTLRCGHNFCRDCIDQNLNTQDGAGVYSCPECREEFQERPTLQKNITLCNVVENFLSTHPHQEEITGICCTYCIHSPVPAVRSCLLCEASLCDNHLRVHSKSLEHVLTDPKNSLENRKCDVHKELLKYYCTQDAACICVSCCLIGEHRGHNLESLDEAAEKKKEKLSKILQKCIKKREKIEERVRRVEERKRKAQEKASREAERVTALFIDIRRRLDDLEKRVLSEISRQEEQLSLSLSDVIQKLEIKKDELSRKMRHIEELCNMADPLTVLQDPDIGDLYDPEERRGDEDTGGHDGGDEDTGRHDGGDDDAGGDQGLELISHISQTLSDIIRGVDVALYGEGPADILLDVNTAANNILISDDLKTATWTEIVQNRPETAERFQNYYQVMSSGGFSSGRHYWDVEINESGLWRVGMCYPSIDKMGVKSYIGNNKKSWCLRKIRSSNQYSVIHDCKQILLPHQISSNRFRICLDYKAGQLSFYELCDPIRHLHTFTATFTDPLSAALGVGTGSIKISGGNSSCEEPSP